MVEQCLDNDRVKSFSFHKIIFIGAWSLDPDMYPVQTTDKSMESSLVVESTFSPLVFLRETSKKFKLKSVRSDEEGRYLILEAIIQDVPFLLVNIYAPNTTTKQSLFFQTLSAFICDEGYNESDYKILLGGDLNVAMDPDLDSSGGNPVVKDSVKCVEDVMMNYD